MTTINTADDLLSLLRENQEFREAVRKAILTEELLALPAVFSAFASEIRGEIKEVRGEIKRVDSEIRGELKEIRGDITEMRGDITEMRGDITEIRGELKEIRGDITEMRGDIKRIENKQDGHTNDIGELKGIGLETKLYNRGPSYVATLLSVHDVQRIRVAEKDDNSREFNEDIREALRGGTITFEEYDRVLRTDMIVGALRVGALNPVYTAIEASYSVTRNDIRKVNETAGILGRVFPDAEIHSALCYMNIASFVEHEANQQGIHLLAVRHLE